MPIYEYKCGKCGEFEQMQRMSDAPLTKCPTCGRKITKLISSTSFQLKGGGWYVTDYAKKDGGKPAKEKTNSESTSTASDDKGGSTSTGESPKTTKSESAKSAGEKTAAV